jgi:ADP-ribosylglycohydrolase
MLGAIAGDVIGSAYEWHKAESRDFPLFTDRSHFTDDTVMTCAIARAILDAREAGVEPDYRGAMLDLGRRYPHAGYGGMFRQWLASGDPQPYNSFGNGSAMRVSPVGFLFDDERMVLGQARASAMPTHDHPEGIKGAQAIALTVFLARNGAHKEEIRRRIEREFGYDLSRTLEEIRPGYSFDVTCQGSVPEAIVAFLDAADLEAAVRNAIWLGGDADTQACIAGAIAEAMWGVPAEIEGQVIARLPDDLAEVVRRARSDGAQSRRP